MKCPLTDAQAHRSRGCNIIQPRMVPKVIGWCVVVSAFEYPVTFAYMIGKEHPGLCVHIAHHFPRTPAGRTSHFDARTGVVKPVSVIISHSKPNFGWVRCRVYIGPLHPTNFFNSKSPEGSGTDYPSSCPCPPAQSSVCSLEKLSES